MLKYKKHYLVYPDARIYSIRKQVFMRPGLASNGYLTVAINGKTETVHSIVAKVCLGSRPRGYDICHRDGNKLNNHYSNLRYDTRAGNFADMETHGTRVLGSRKGNSKLNEQEAREIWGGRGVFSQSELATMYGVSSAAIQAIHDGRTWKHVTHA